MNAAAFDKLKKAQQIMLLDSAFFGVLSMRLAVVERPDVGTMATDGVHLFYAPDFVMQSTVQELIFTWAHECMHCALQHMARLGNRDMKEANIAADLAINPELVRMNVGKAPAGILLDWQYADMSFEEIYAARAQAKRKEEEQARKDAQGQAGDAGKPGQEGQAQAGQKPGKQGQAGDAPGQGQGKPADAQGQAGQAQGGPATQGAPAAGNEPGNGKPGQGQAQGQAGGRDVNGIGGIMRPGDGSDAAAQAVADDWQVWTRQAIATAAKQAGDMPGMFKRILDEIGAPRVDYRQALRDFIDSRVAFDYSFMRPNRRFAHAGMILPGPIQDGLEHLVFAVDTSGSIDAHMLEQAASEIIGAADDGKVQRLTVLFADTDVRNVQTFERGDTIADKLDARGGGGTRFDKAFQWIEEHAPDATAVVYLTDMECSHFGRDPGLPVLWAVHGDSRKFERLAARAPFGDAVYIGRLE